MKKYILSCWLLLLCLVSANAQHTDANIMGHVLESKTGEHISFATIVLKGTNLGVQTDATGHYFMKDLPLGKHTLIASAVGYVNKEIQVEIIRNKTLEINFSLTDDPIKLNEVVVTSNRNGTSRMKAPTIVNVLSNELFTQTNANTLSQGLVFQPGVRVETNCQNCGFSQVRINGLEGPYSQILIDSRPIFSSLAGVYGLEQIPTSMIDRVEVVRGGGSALFGANAIGGVINIITKEPKSNSASVSNSTNFIYGKTPDVQTSFNASLVADDYKSGLTFFGAVRERKEFDYDKDGFSELPKLSQKNVGLRGFYRFSPYSKVTAEYHNISEFRRGGDQMDLPPHQVQIAEQLDHNIHSGNINFNWLSQDYNHKLDLYASAQSVDRKSYYGAEKDEKAYGKTDDISVATGLQYNYNFDRLFFMPSTFTSGVEYAYNHVNDKVLGYNREQEQTTKTASAFIQNEWKNDQWSILLGARMDKHNLLKNPVFSPRVNLRYGPNEHFNFRASYSSGFRAPQAFDEDLHIDIAGGEPIFIELDPNLKEERSHSFSASGDFYFNIGDVRFNILAEGFYTDLKNVFVLNPKGTDPKGKNIQIKTNGEGAVVKGLNIEGRIVPGRKFQLQFGATLQSSKYKADYEWSEDKTIKPQRRMFKTPDSYGYLTAVYKPINALSLSLSGTYTGNMLVQHRAGYIEKNMEVETPKFFDMGTKVAYKFYFGPQSNLELNAGVLNIFNSFQKDFDKGEKRDSDYIYGPSMPRTVYVGLKFAI
ncbi:Colicin I receptor precursor [Porphyromonas macacae]|uniref:Colicin I receptor n=1 Tax=Porphyromonas macacae TaxID=28115 RepID=A0A379DHD3_9PORP|nr:TonB-dependent receptor [Porphyromonas macacae]SUB77789.1 Colicin I receptor precursor [Porphyromonas macacae]